MLGYYGYDEIKRLNQERIDRSLARYRLMTAMTTEYQVASSPDAEVIELKAHKDCECTARIGA